MVGLKDTLTSADAAAERKVPLVSFSDRDIQKCRLKHVFFKSFVEFEAGRLVDSMRVSLQHRTLMLGMRRLRPPGRIFFGLQQFLMLAAYTGTTWGTANIFRYPSMALAGIFKSTALIEA